MLFVASFEDDDIKSLFISKFMEKFWINNLKMQELYMIGLPDDYQNSKWKYFWDNIIQDIMNHRIKISYYAQEWSSSSDSHYNTYLMRKNCLFSLEKSTLAKLLNNKYDKQYVRVYKLS